MVEFESSPLVSIVKRTPRKSEYLVELSDGSKMRVLEEQVDRFNLVEGACIDQATLEEIDFTYEYGKAKQAVKRLLEVRPRTETEIRRRLVQRKTPGDVLGRLVEDLRAEGILDDRVFARLWIEEKIARGTHGRRLIRHDLQKRGIHKEVLEEELARLYSVARELENASGLARKQLLKHKKVDGRLRRQRVFGYLQRRGFAADVATEAINDAAAPVPGEGEV
jgi:regulatory protein